MPRLIMLPVIMREYFGERSLPREPEPDLVMGDADQVAAYTEAGRIDGVMAAAYLFHSARVTQVIHGCKKVLDLACGPATQLAQIAGLNPDIEFLGIELSEEMLNQARKHVQDMGLKNVGFMQADMTDLNQIPPASVDGVISTMALHHLPTFAHLEKCFGEIRRVLKPDGALYLVDFGRLKMLRSVIYFAYMNTAFQPHIFSLDYERSLRAAFLKEEFAQLTRETLGDTYQVFPTFLMPILVLMKSADRLDRTAVSDRFKTMRDQLPRRYRQDLDDIRQLFRLSGLNNDPFS